MTLRLTPVEIVEAALAEGTGALLTAAPGWSRVRLGEVAAITNGSPFKSHHFNVEGRGIALIRIRDVKTSAVSTWYDGPWDSELLVRRGDLLVGMDGDFNAATWAGPDGLLNQRVCRIDVNDDRYDRRFLEFALQGYLDAIWKATSSTTVKHLSSKSVADIPLPDPPLEEQRRIVDILDDHLSRLDAAGRGLAKSAGRASALVVASAAQVVGHAEGSAVSVPLASLARIGTGATPRRGDATYWEGGAIPWVTSGELSQGVIEKTRELITARALAETSVKLWPKGTLLVAMYGEGKTRGTVGELGISATTNQACAAIVLDDPSSSMRAWIRLVLESRYDSMRRAASGGVQPNLSLAHFRSMAIPLPSERDRERLVASHAQRVDAAHSLAANTERSRARLLSLRRAILASAFSGRLTGRSSDLDGAEELAFA